MAKSPSKRSLSNVLFTNTADLIPAVADEPCDVEADLGVLVSLNRLLLKVHLHSTSMGPTTKAFLKLNWSSAVPSVIDTDVFGSSLCPGVWLLLDDYYVVFYHHITMVILPFSSMSSCFFIGQHYYYCIQL